MLECSVISFEVFNAGLLAVGENLIVEVAGVQSFVIGKIAARTGGCAHARLLVVNLELGIHSRVRYLVCN